MAEVKWIKLRVGMFDGMSFKKIKKAQIGGESFRDKLTAVWFELMDFAGRCNHDGAFISPREIPFYELSDIAMMIDRDEEELKICMNFFIKEGMVSVIEDVYMLSNWSEYQNVDGLEKIKQQNRIRQAKYREKQKLLACNVTVTEDNALEEDIEIDTDIEEEVKKPKRESCMMLYKRLLPEYLLTEKLQDKMSEWITYKMERRESYKEQGMKTLLRRIENSRMEYGEDAVCEMIDDSISSNYVGIVFDKLKQGKYQSKTAMTRQDAIKNRVSDVDGW